LISFYLYVYIIYIYILIYLIYSFQNISESIKCKLLHESLFLRIFNIFYIFIFTHDYLKKENDFAFQYFMYLLANFLFMIKYSFPSV